MFKFNVGQQIWYMYDNKIHTAPVGARTLCEVDGTFAKTRPGGAWNPKILYGTIHGNWREDQIFGSWKELSTFLEDKTVYGSMNGT